MDIDWVRLVAVAALILVAGVFGILEVSINERRKSPGGGYGSVRGAFRWLVVVFAIDGLVTFVAYTFLDAALADEFWGNPVLIYFIAFAVSPLILRFEVDFMLPIGPRAHEVVSVVPTFRRFMSDLVGTSSARYRARWMTNKAIPTIRGRGVAHLCDHATTYFRNATNIDDPTKTARIDQIEIYRRDRGAIDGRLRSACQLMIDYGGLGSLKDYIAMKP